MTPTIQLDQARERLLSKLIPLSTETIPIARAAGRYAAANVVAPIELPPFDNSAMDGFAIRSADTQGATKGSPRKLHVVGECAAGQAFVGQLVPGQSVRIFTGSPLPNGADAVVMQEDVRFDATESQIELSESVRPWDHVRFAGEDVKRGVLLLTSGERVRVTHLAVLAASGVASLMVSRRPRVVVAATGDELVAPGEPLGPGKIYESNALVLAQLLRGSGAEVEVAPFIRDDPGETREALRAATSAADAVVTAGGASVGAHDYVKSAIEELGGTVEFWRISMKPGRPFFFGQLAGKPILGVPGNPVSAFVTAVLLVLPAMARLQGAGATYPRHEIRLLAEALSNEGDRPHFVRVQTLEDGRVVAAGIQASHVLSSLARADGLVEVLPHSILEREARVRVLRWD